jgi:hypothetical protein
MADSVQSKTSRMTIHPRIGASATQSHPSHLPSRSIASAAGRRPRIAACASRTAATSHYRRDIIKS